MAENDQTNSGRDARGRFGPGNPGGPGGSRKRAELRRAAENALTPQHIDAIIRKATRMALEGNTRAMEVVFDRTTGRPPLAEIEPEALDIQLPEMTTLADCGRAAEMVIAGRTTGRLNGDDAKTLLDGIKTRVQTLRATQKEREAAAATSAPAREVPSKVLRAWFLRFKKTGELPEDTEDAAALIGKVKAGFTLADPTCPSATPEDWFDGFVVRPRKEAECMDALLNEAVHGQDLVRLIARSVLQKYADLGLDVTKDLLEGEALPEFGSVGAEVMGLTQQIVRGRYKKQAKRLLERRDAARKRQPVQPQRILERRNQLHNALACFQFAGERPDDPEILAEVLLIGEFATLQRAACGHKEADVLLLFDTAAQTTGDEREAAITKLQQMAKAGRFMGSEQKAA